jgi:hypothetical protein
MRMYEIEQSSVTGGWLLREPEAEPLVEQVRVLLDAVEREQCTLPDCLQQAFTPWLAATREWLDLLAGPVDDERLREVADRLRAYRSLIVSFAERRG